ncbi:MAG: OadG family protein [Sulfurimonas sp.]|uniref:OadG family protein n=1 Tax=Sulfurimonas sp. TaxID=2022749 RepID=UPI0026345D04|nr:OadG family protein [Sulfurimonas sp.]MDD2652730.1 OadG family protein [Sulfurimonas sp.]MDD3450636.1 OadG family protein [Sulfurimonas sp.]
MDMNPVLESLKFLVLGMGTVFLFLVIMIYCMNIMSSILSKYFPEARPDVNAKLNLATSSTQKDDKKIVAAITAAIKYHREG